MSGKCSLTINGKTIRANLGDTLVDAALGGRIVLPHDCCSGQCETCRVRVLSGAVDDFGTREKDTVLGCLATLEGDAEISFDPVPVVRNTRGVVSSIRPIGRDLLEVRIEPNRAVPWLPGQYLRLTFKGYPPRDYSPTFPLDLEETERDVLVFHVKVYPDGKVSSVLGTDIGVGHKVMMKGPFGNGFLRRQDERLVLVSTGTGFAPIWSIAAAARLGQPWRRVEVIAGARFRADLYMGEAMKWLRGRGVAVTVTAGDGDGRDVARRRPAELLPALTANDVVYAAGSPSQVDAVRVQALAADATFYADPFYAADARFSLSEWIQARFRSQRHGDTPAIAATL